MKDKEEYEEIAPALKDYKIVDDGIWLSWLDLWRIDAVACRNGIKAMNEMKAHEDKSSICELLFQNFIGQRMLIEEIAEIVRPKQDMEKIICG